MTGSLKRHPSEEPEESPKAKRRESPGAPEPSTAATTEASPTVEKKGDSVPTPTLSFLSPATKVGGVSITEKVGLVSDKSKVNGNSTSILSSGFSLAAGSSLFSPTSNGSSFGSSGKGTNIFAAALSNVSGGTGGGGIFGSSSSSGGGIFGSSSSGSSGFVFGGNMSDRVVTPAAKDGEKSEKKEETDKSEETDKRRAEGETSSENSAVETSETKKTSLKKLEVTSGEEDETRILQTSCKLYQFCPEGKTWIDRDRGTLRLNEKEQDGVTSSRLVIRSKAVMRVMLNTKIFADMIVNRANLTTIRISGMDEGRMNTYLIKVARNECDKLHTALLKKREEERHKVGETTSSETKISNIEHPSSDTPADVATSENQANTSDPDITPDPEPSEFRASPQTAISDEKDLSTEEVLPPEKSDEKGEDPVPGAESDKTVNGAKSQDAPEETSKSEVSKESTAEPEKTAS